MPCSGVVAQLVRASACHAEGRGFEPLQSRQINKKTHRKRCVFFIESKAHPSPLTLRRDKKFKVQSSEFKVQNTTLVIASAAIHRKNTAGGMKQIQL